MVFTRRQQRRLITLIAALFVFIYGAFTRETEKHTPEVLPAQTVATESARVASVIDGDTIILTDQTRVRYIGMNSPELQKNDCFAQEAKRKNEELLKDKDIVLIKDISETDRYGRLLRYVFLPNGLFVNKQLVEEGYAYASSYPPDVSRQSELRDAQKSAVTSKKGMWNVCEMN